MARLPKCGICEKTGDPKDMVKIGAKYYHKGVCEHKKKQELEDNKYFNLCVDYLMQLTNTVEPNPAWYGTLKRFKETLNMKYHGIYIALQYYYGKLNNKVKDNTTVLEPITWAYAKAKDDYVQDLQIKKNARQFIQDGKQPFIEGEKIVITKEDLQKQQEVQIPSIRKIDLSSIDIEED